MEQQLLRTVIAIVMAPLLGSLAAGLFRQQVGPRGAHSVTIAFMCVAFFLSLWVAYDVFALGAHFNGTLYTWGSSGSFTFNVGFLIDPLTTVMLVAVTFVSLLVHLYSVGYMAEDPGYQRFFSYISLFTFAMLMLVTANNFLQLFFGWEGVGLVSYLLIGFWFTRDRANEGSLKAFLVNRVGDFGFLLGLAAILTFFGSLDYATVFAKLPQVVSAHETVRIFPNVHWPLLNVIGILLFVGAMGKSAQVPLHVWLPESMEGPTPISALIHAATMVTAGVFMVCRMSPIFQQAPVAQSVILVVGATGALFTGLLALVQYDIKRVVAYSTLSQLGYMIAAAGASAYAAGMFHLLTHACFKALLFLGAGSVIMAMHHEQDMRKMGGLYKYMPITYVTFLVGALALSALPPFAGYYSKDAIIQAIHVATIPGAGYGYLCVLLGSFVTGCYTFRAFFMTFHTQERISEDLRAHLKESPWVIWLPLVLLAIPSFFVGFLLVKPMLYSTPNCFGDSLSVLPQYNVLQVLNEEFVSVWSSTWHAVLELPFWFALAGVGTAWVAYEWIPTLPHTLATHFPRIYNALVKKYGFDAFNEWFFVKGGRRLSQWCYRVGDKHFIDDNFINGTGRLVQRASIGLRRLQSGYLYHYALAMIVGLLGLLVWLIIL